jgi:hypothetical protein
VTEACREYRDCLEQLLKVKKVYQVYLANKEGKASTVSPEKKEIEVFQDYRVGPDHQVFQASTASKVKRAA